MNDFAEKKMIKYTYVTVFLQVFHAVTALKLGPSSQPPECRTDNVSMVTNEMEVTQKFFEPYGRFQRPRNNSSEPVAVFLRLVVSGIKDIIERKRLIVINGFVQVRWIDEFRVWQNVTPYNCIHYIVIPAKKIWLPDLAQMNSQNRYQLIAMANEKVRVYSNGYAHYSPGGTFTAFCKFDLSQFPFDTQTCAIKMESWRYTIQYMKFEVGGNVSIQYWTENEQWSLVSTGERLAALSYNEPWNAFDHVEFYLTIKRKVMYYMMNVLIPSSVIALAHVATFTLPVGDVERVNISFTCLFAYSVFQVMIVGDLPRASDHIPILTVYINLQMIYIALSILGEGISLYFLDKANAHDAYCKKNSTVPLWLLTLADKIGVILLLDEAPSQQSIFEQPLSFGRNVANSISLDDTNQEGRLDDDGRQSSDRVGKRCKCTRASLKSRQWKHISAVNERLVAVVYLSSIIVTPIIMFGIIPLI